MKETNHRNNKQCNRQTCRKMQEKSDTLFKTKLKSMQRSKGKRKLLLFCLFVCLFVCFLSRTFFPRDSTKQYLFSANHAFFKQQTNMPNGNFTRKQKNSREGKEEKRRKKKKKVIRLPFHVPKMVFDRALKTSDHPQK